MNSIDKMHDQIPSLVAISPCWHDSEIYQMFCDDCSPYHKMEDINDVKVAEAVENSSTSDILNKRRKMY